MKPFAIAMLVAALVMHLTWCDWHFGYNYWPHIHESMWFLPPEYRIINWIPFLGARIGSNATASVAGLVVPILIVGGAVALLRSRVGQGSRA